MDNQIVRSQRLFRRRIPLLAGLLYLLLGGVLVILLLTPQAGAVRGADSPAYYGWLYLLGTLPLVYVAVTLCLRWLGLEPAPRSADGHSGLRDEARLRIHSTVYHEIMEGVVVTDADANIISVNPAFTHIMGYRPEEVLGKNPSLFKSGKHDPDFYQRMWDSIVTHGSWSGEIWNRRKDGSIQPEWLNISRVRNAAGDTTHYVGSFTDTSVIKASQEQLHRLAHHDILTGLPNRLLFNDRLGQAIKHAQRGGYQVAVLFMDLDDFKKVNDTLGHQTGDELLRQAAQRLESQLRKGDTVARLGGDEFVILLHRLARSEYAAVVANKVEQQLHSPFVIAGKQHFVGVSIGIALYPQDGDRAELLMRNADISMYRAKELGKGGFQFYTDDLSLAASARAELERELRGALEAGAFELHYQPEMMLGEARVIAVEALLRWRHPRLGLLAPADFIPLAEQTGLILDIGGWVLEEACRVASGWQSDALQSARIAVNVSTTQLQRGDLLAQVEQALANSGLAADRLELELNESFVMGDVEKSIDLLRRLKALGVGIVIDDFGTGYSSLSHLQKLPIDRLKLDRSFLADVPTDKGHCAIANAIVSLSDKLRIPVVAEGVENDEQLSFVTGIGCLAAQGYRYTHPLPADQFQRQYDH
ncbi:MAG: EAL domain-containing protein [Gammaproteobacteria bacterium]|nr:EAL domain-containing protein [Gammaproteobacteria bacterium]